MSQRRTGEVRAQHLITSRENEKLKLVRKLHERRWRDKLDLFVAEGEDLVDAARNAGYEAVDVLVSGENVEPELLAEVSTLAHPPRVIGVFRRRESSGAAGTRLALWRISDPGNVGTLLRSADAFGAAVGLSEGCADPFGPKALRAAMDRRSVCRCSGSRCRGVPSRSSRRAASPWKASTSSVIRASSSGRSAKGSPTTYWSAAT